MPETHIVHLLYYAAAIAVVVWLYFAVRCTIYCCRHDSYIRKNFPDLSKAGSDTIFNGNWNSIHIYEKILSSRTAPDEHISLLRRKIRPYWFGVFVSLTVLPGGFFVLLLLTLILKSEI